MLEITIWDVQHGNAAYIKTPNNRNIAVDLGAGESFSPLRELYARTVRQLDWVVITHPHRDHIEEISDLAIVPALSAVMPWHLSEDAIRRGNRQEDSGFVDEYLRMRRGITFPAPAANNPSDAANFGGVSFSVFGASRCADGNLNNHSLVVVATYANLKIVISGDNEPPSWNELLLDDAFVAAVAGTDVFVASHHGRDSGYCVDLFDAMGKPRLIVISDGRFGDTSATDRYRRQSRGWTVYDATGEGETRYCVTTRCDGHITVRFGWNQTGESNFLNVTTSKVNTTAMLARIWSGR
jgi:beta-lactamase superfamily II metal-dependent hydrolase